MNTAIYRESAYSVFEDEFGGSHRLTRHPQEYPIHMDPQGDHHVYSDTSGMSACSTSDESRCVVEFPFKKNKIGPFLFSLSSLIW